MQILSLSAADVVHGSMAITPERKREKGKLFGERRYLVLVNGHCKDFQLSWDLLCAMIAFFFLLITSLRKNLKAKTEERSSAKIWGSHITSG